jgi:hypothetical protein
MLGLNINFLIQTKWENIYLPIDDYVFSTVMPWWWFRWLSSWIFQLIQRIIFNSKWLW